MACLKLSRLAHLATPGTTRAIEISWFRSSRTSNLDTKSVEISSTKNLKRSKRSSSSKPAQSTSVTKSTARRSTCFDTQTAWASEATTAASTRGPSSYTDVSLSAEGTSSGNSPGKRSWLLTQRSRLTSRRMSSFSTKTLSKRRCWMPKSSTSLGWNQGKI